MLNFIFLRFPIPRIANSTKYSPCSRIHTTKEIKNKIALKILFTSQTKATINYALFVI